jgi:dolichol-phosphate mannosyltransferase
MIPMIENADLVTASPYHPDGKVFNVPPWRLFLSRTLCWIYSKLLGKAIHTYTSCFRVYRKSAVESLSLQHGGFLGVAEILIRLRLRGGRILEFPTTLESRLFGESKMKIVRTIWSHLGLVRELVGLRLRGGGPPPDSVPAVPAAPAPAPAPQPIEKS